jgi:two-component system, NarL family, sensor histidine kinase UhpB
MSRSLARIKEWFLRVPIFNRLLIGNSTVIILGAVGGTLLTRHLTLVGNLNLILLFVALGLFLTLLVNYLIVSSSLRPLKELRLALDQAQSGDIVLHEALRMQSDPDIKRLVAAIESLLNRLDTRNAQLRALSERAISAQEEERNRIARNLHDDTAQSLSTLLVHLERLESLLPENSPTLESRISQVRRLAEQTLDELRLIIWDLRPSILDDLGLAPAIRWYAGARLEDAGLRVRFNITTDGLRLSDTLETTLFRVIQEAISNILRHAHASEVEICIWPEQDSINLVVEDNGIGFDVSRKTGEAVTLNQLGLLGIQERATLVGGAFRITSTPGIGTRLHIRAPMN